MLYNTDINFTMCRLRHINFKRRNFLNYLGNVFINIAKYLHTSLTTDPASRPVKIKFFCCYAFVSFFAVGNTLSLTPLYIYLTTAYLMKT